MAPAISINLFALVSLALFSISLTPIAANAVSLEQSHVARNLHHAHAGIAKKKRDGPQKRCKPLPTSSSPPPSSNTPSDTPAYTPPSSPSPTDNSSLTDTPAASPSPTPTSSTSSSPSPTSTPTSGSIGKVGISWSNNEETSLCNFKSPDTTHVYNWQYSGYGDIVNPASCGLTYILHCADGSSFPGCPDAVYASPPGTYVLFLNEPDQSGQANMDVADAVGLWKQYMQPMGDQGYKIISPACTNSPDGFTWIQQFVSQVEQSGGWMDGIATHIYSTDLSYATSFLTTFIQTFPGYGIWVTEYACEDYSGNNQQLDADGVSAYMNGLSSFMFENPAITVSFGFGFFTQPELQANNVNPLNAFIGDNDEPTPLGYSILYPS